MTDKIETTELFIEEYVWECPRGECRNTLESPEITAVCDNCNVKFNLKEVR